MDLIAIALAGVAGFAFGLIASAVFRAMRWRAEAAQIGEALGDRIRDSMETPGMEREREARAKLMDAEAEERKANAQKTKAESKQVK